MISEIAYAKINLQLNILGLRKDGYHEVDMVMQTVDFFDKIIFVPTSDDGIIVESNIPEINNKNNLAYRAAELLAKRFDIQPKLKIIIEKNIFMAAGLAGGSSDAAAVLRGCNKLWNLNLTAKDLEKIGAELGSDIPFLICGGKVRATGRGEILSALPDSEHFVVLAKPQNIEVSTKWAYQEFDNLPQDKLLNAPRNVLELAVFPYYPVLQNMKDAAENAGAEFAMMSGSGPTIFALCKNYADGEKIANVLKKFNADVVLAKFTKRRCDV